MQIHHQFQDGIATVTLDGKFTFETHVGFKEACYPLLGRAEVSAIHLNLAAVSYMDSSSLGMLLLLREKAEAGHKKICLEHPSPNVMAILKAVQFGKLFQITEG